MTEEEKEIVKAARHLSAMWDAMQAAGEPLTGLWWQELHAAVQAASIRADALKPGDWVEYLGRPRVVGYAELAPQSEGIRYLVEFVEPVVAASLRANHRLAKCGDGQEVAG